MTPEAKRDGKLSAAFAVFVIVATLALGFLSGCRAVKKWTPEELDAICQERGLRWIPDVQSCGVRAADPPAFHPIIPPPVEVHDLRVPRRPAQPRKRKTRKPFPGAHTIPR